MPPPLTGTSRGSLSPGSYLRKSSRGRWAPCLPEAPALPACPAPQKPVPSGLLLAAVTRSLQPPAAARATRRPRRPSCVFPLHSCSPHTRTQTFLWLCLFLVPGHLCLSLEYSLFLKCSSPSAQGALLPLGNPRVPRPTVSPALWFRASLSDFTPELPLQLPCPFSPSRGRRAARSRDP